MTALKDVTISVLMAILFGLVIGTPLWYFREGWTFKDAFWVGYTIGVGVDFICMMAGLFIRWRKKRRERVYLTGNSRYGKH